MRSETVLNGVEVRLETPQLRQATRLPTSCSGEDLRGREGVRLSSYEQGSPWWACLKRHESFLSFQSRGKGSRGAVMIGIGRTQGMAGWLGIDISWYKLLQCCRDFMTPRVQVISNLMLLRTLERPEDNHTVVTRVGDKAVLW